MDLRDEILARAEALGLEQQRASIQFVTSLASSGAKDKTALAFRAFAGSLDAISAQEMKQAIEEGCEPLS